MLERQWRLQYPGVDYLWGGFDPADSTRRNLGRTRNTAAPEVSDTEIESETAGRSRQDGRTFGQDFRRGVTMTFQLGMKGAGRPNSVAQVNARTLMRESQLAWRGDGVRLVPGAMAKLTTQRDGLELFCYGRPARWAPNVSRLMTACDGGATCTFETDGDVWYAAEQSARIDLVPPSSVGGVGPPVIPGFTLGSGQVASGAVVVTGVLPTWPSVEVFGPIANPVVRVAGVFEWRLLTSIPAGQSVTLDARPWVRSILRSTGGSVAGLLSRAYSRLQDASLPVGTQAVSLAGADPTGTAYMMMRWSPAHASMV